MPEAERDFLAALTPNGRALSAFEQLAPSHQREFFAFILDGPPRERGRRIYAAVDILAQTA
jgi:hypothetical protein